MVSVNKYTLSKRPTSEGPMKIKQEKLKLQMPVTATGALIFFKFYLIKVKT